jgi:hypothetical protein
MPHTLDRGRQATELRLREPAHGDDALARKEVQESVEHRQPMSLSASTCHHGLKTAPCGDFFSGLRKFVIDGADASSENRIARTDCNS